MVYMTLASDPRVADLLAVSALIGSDPLLVQAAGGNTSLKDGDRMLIKASGTWLAQAFDKDIMVEVDLPGLRDAIARGDQVADQPQEFLSGTGKTQLRPSIETSVHAVIDAPVVLHVHCVATLAIAICEDAEGRVKSLLGDLGAVWVPYVKPGFTLAQEITRRSAADTKIVVLGNHGLVVAGDSVADAEALIAQVQDRLQGPIRASLPPRDLVAPSGWQLAQDDQTHALALDPERWAMAAAGSLYPDHVIYLNTAVQAVDDVAEIRDDQRAAKLVLVRNHGALVPDGASASVHALTRCLGDVLARVEGQITTLSLEDDAALLNWDAEKYRQDLDRKS